MSGLVLGVAAPAGVATSSTPGDGCLVVSDGFGRVTINLTRGVVFGRFQSGSLLASDLGAPLPRVTNALGQQLAPVKISDHLWKFGTADNVRFRTSGATKLTIREATFIELSVVGRGTTILSATTFDPTLAGKFSVDAASFCQDNLEQMPAVATKYPISSPVAG
jgi:hypothetical protein